MKQKVKEFLSKYKGDMVFFLLTSIVAVLFGSIFTSAVVAACFGTLALCAVTLAFKKEGWVMPMAIESGIIGIVLGTLLSMV